MNINSKTQISEIMEKYGLTFHKGLGQRQEFQNQGTERMTGRGPAAPEGATPASWGHGDPRPGHLTFSGHCGVHERPRRVGLHLLVPVLQQVNQDGDDIMLPHLDLALQGDAVPGTDCEHGHPGSRVTRRPGLPVLTAEGISWASLPHGRVRDWGPPGAQNCRGRPGGGVLLPQGTSRWGAASRGLT